MPKRELERRIDYRSRHRVTSNNWWYIDPDGAPPQGGDTVYTLDGIRVEEVDGAPSVGKVVRIIVPNGSLTNNFDGSVTLVFGTGSGSSAHQVHFSLPLPATDFPPGPTNITGVSYTIKALRFASDGAVEGTMTPGGSFAFTAGGGVDRTDDLDIEWADGVTLTVEITAQGDDGSYLTIDAYVE